MHKTTQSLNSASAIEANAAVAFGTAWPAEGSFAAPRTARQNKPQREPEQACAWFALCGNPATQTAMHPDLGERAICDRCVGLIQTATRMVELSDGGIRQHQTRPCAAGLGPAVRRARGAGAVRARSAAASRNFAPPPRTHPARPAS